VPGYHPIPDIKPNKAVPTKLSLAGRPQTLQLTYGKANGPNGPFGIATVKDQLGGTATVVAPNWFSGKVRPGRYAPS
jgi:hypothetical protein